MKNLRKYFSDQLSGLGLELGPLHRPMVKHRGMTVRYVDRMKVEELRKHYPELSEFGFVGPDIIDDAQTLSSIRYGDFYDFLIAAHIIEHLPNPIEALRSWCRVVKPGGRVYLVVPDKMITFDRNREVTPLEHMILDYESPDPFRDFIHFLDYSANVNGKTGAETITHAYDLKNKDYSIHYHVFLPSGMLELLEWVRDNVGGFSILEGPLQEEGSDEFHFMLEVR